MPFSASRCCFARSSRYWSTPPRQVPQAAVDHRVLLVGDALDQVPVVGDDEQRAGEGVEQVLDRGEHVGVEVVGRLVEDEHVRLGEQDQQQLQAALLAAGEVLDRGAQLGAGEAHPLEQLAGVISLPPAM